MSNNACTLQLSANAFRSMTAYYMGYDSQEPTHDHIEILASIIAQYHVTGKRNPVPPEMPPIIHAAFLIMGEYWRYSGMDPPIDWVNSDLPKKLQDATQEDRLFLWHLIQTMHQPTAPAFVHAVKPFFGGHLDYEKYSIAVMLNSLPTNLCAPREQWYNGYRTLHILCNPIHEHDVEEL